jgi:hypothetical protein
MKMIINNVMLKLKKEHSDKITKTRDVLLSMQGKIEFLRDIKVEVNIRPGQSSYDIMFITKFTSMEDLDAYLTHPVHLEVAKYIGSVLDTQASVCYEA